MTTFVLILFFWETNRGYAITNVPGYENKPACEAAAKDYVATDFRAGYTKAVCIPGPAPVSRS